MEAEDFRCCRLTWRGERLKCGKCGRRFWTDARSLRWFGAGTIGSPISDVLFEDNYVSDEVRRLAAPINQ